VADADVLEERFVVRRSSFVVRRVSFDVRRVSFDVRRVSFVVGGSGSICMDIEGKARQIRLVLFDVDGVLTDGKVLLHADGSESKLFDIRDGTGVVWAERSGIRIGLLSARHSPTTTQRAAQLGITLVHQGVASKLETFEQILRETHLAEEHVAFLGDDVLDLPVLSRAGLSAAPADAVDDVRTRVDWVARARGGDGAARELIELVLRAQGKWDALLASYAGEPGKQPA
jgi:3-deoxy-D-manno-octulosonate 8-phosphate phosphatase (KDO 8-P phosphatase)